MKQKKIKDIMSSAFIGIYKDKREWKNKSSLEIANELRRKAWYGQ